jgi:hypothetical protein
MRCTTLGRFRLKIIAIILTARRFEVAETRVDTTNILDLFLTILGCNSLSLRGTMGT